jgi:topoisomerase-4 subunit A
MNEDQRDLFDDPPPMATAPAEDAAGSRRGGGDVTVIEEAEPAGAPAGIGGGAASGGAGGRPAAVPAGDGDSGSGIGGSGNGPPAAGGGAAGGGGGLPPHFAPMSGEFGDALPLGRYASTQYLQYAIATVKDRALPRVGDGQKPVQGRILYAMWDNGIRAGTKRTKSAAVVGDVLGKLHPHGDQSVYDALVRLAQDFTMRYPLVDGEGNFGSRDGDEAAAYRYTEARLMKFAEVLLSELEMGTVDFAPNYDGTREEPVVLPARLPVVLLNGASGIAVGMATEIPSHNLNEVAAAAIAMVRDPEISVAGLMRHIKGPDFPGGGQIITPRADLKEAYTAGRGTVRVRARWTIERLARGQWQMVVHELPPGASTRKVLEEIDALTNPQPRPGKKSITAEQSREKQLVLSMLDRARDESDRLHPVRLVLEPKSSRIDENEFVNLLLAKTSLEGNVPLNLVMVGLDGRPTGKTLRDILHEWLQFRFTTVTRRTRHRLDKVLDRIHVLEGRMLVLLNVDKVIRIIRAADDPKADLIAAFRLTDRQAEDILEMRLRQLAKLEHIRIEQELAELKGEQASLQKVLDDRKALEDLVVAEIEADAKAYGDRRRTRIEEAEKAEVETPVLDDPITVIFSRNGWVRARQSHGVDPAALTFKEGDGLGVLIPCRTVDPVVFLDSKGRAYTVEATQLPSARGDGVPASSLVDVQDGAKILHCLAGKADTKVLVAATGGYGFAATLGDMVSNRKAGREFLSVDEGDVPLPPVPYAPSPGNHAALLADNGKLLLVQMGEVKAQAKGRGTQLMGLDEGEKLVAVAVSDQPVLAVLGIGRGGKEKLIELGRRELGHYAGSRANKGRVLPEKVKPVALRVAVKPDGGG